MIGVVGGGQLAQMLAKAGKERRVDVVVQTSSTSDPAAKYSKKFILFDSENIEGTIELSKSCVSITFENEWVDVSQLSELEKSGVKFIPNLASLSHLVNKISQRKLLANLSIPCSEWIDCSSLDINNLSMPRGWSFPVMAKASKGGYDGKGTLVIRNIDDLQNLLKRDENSDWLLEKWVGYDKELSLVVSRDEQGIIRTFPLVQTVQFQQICDWVLAPAEVEHSVQMMAYNIAASLLNELNYVGVLAIEFFYGEKGLLVNEIAPRTHNSGHFTIDACNSSQFDQQLCIAAGLDIPDPKLTSPGAIMVNLLGLSEENTLKSLDTRLKNIKNLKGVKLHWYGKEEERPGRKMGHVTVLLNGIDSNTRKEEALQALDEIRAIWPIN